ncbi:N-acetylneuraminate lyase [Paenibacillus sp. LMG 31456]|uniref:N-acetylneuraminate lyase n=1 Tax=Paenibacillus foliorum TaxID=2654974 RepID=A0A972GJ19_9BACL|nr:N-acetylneuraminate lyase [Paenibacillus foliorum]NOU91699.1 N-acetylneuraminate lyase [Paenibacillus foliorum]
MNISTTKFKGIFPALLTPMNKDHSVDHDSLERLVEHLLGQRVHGFYVGGSTGEGFILTKEERKQLLETVVRANAGRGTVIAHVGAISTLEAIDLAKHAESSGADAISAVVPFYYKITMREIEEHYLEVMKATKLPMIIYHFPGATGVSLSMDFYKKMSEHPQCLGVKFTSLNLFEMQQIRALCGQDFLIYNGHDEIYSAGALMGADGAIGSTFNVMAPLFVDMYEKVQRGEWTALAGPQAAANEIIAKLIQFDVFAGEKYICYLQGVFAAAHIRQPLKQLQESEKDAIRSYFESSLVLKGR